ncbi:MAG: primosomal protein N' [Rhodospirillaceae bacterium]
MAEAHASFLPDSPLDREGDASVADSRVGVLMPLPLTGAYDYRSDGTLQLGDYVEVPLGPRRLQGVVWSTGEGRVDAGRLRPVVRRFDVPPMSAATRRFIDWVAGYTLSPPGQVLRMAISVPAALETPRPAILCRPTGHPAPPGFKMTAARLRVLEQAAVEPLRGAAELAQAAECGPTVVRGLLDGGLLETVPQVIEPDTAAPDPHRPGPSLSDDQEAAAAALLTLLKAGKYAVSVLDGVTGSGKTEVYFEAIAACLIAGRQVLVLLPEISLSAQWLVRFTQRFGAPPALWHSELTPGRRRDTWRAIAAGAARIVVGARSALFLPYADLGLIVVDEEHDPAFKQDEGVIYQARDMAVARAWIGGIPIVLVSATPSLETVINLESGRYTRLHLPGRHGGASLPEIGIIDLRIHKPEPRRWLAPPLRQAIAETLEAGEQAMIFLNRRGYAPLTLCRSCGFRLQCQSCSAWLVQHKSSGKLLCHHCGHAMPVPEACPNCEQRDSFTACGPGVERIAEEVAELFPLARTAVMASDTLSGPSAVDDLVRKVSARELDLLIGTQVMAKGHHFPMLTLVGVVDADLGLGGGDLRAAERTYQLLHQVAGRAGRAERPGRVLLQSYMPEHPVIQALVDGDRDAFLAAEAEERRDGCLPPFGRLAALVISGEHIEEVDDVARRLGRAAPRSDEVEVLGPAPAPLALLRGRHRRRLLVKAPRSVVLQPLIRQWLASVQIPASVRIQVDIDPYSFL